MGQPNGSTYLMTYVQQQSDLVAMLFVSNIPLRARSCPQTYLITLNSASFSYDHAWSQSDKVLAVT